MAKDKQSGSPTLTRDEPATKTATTPPAAPKTVPTRPSVWQNQFAVTRQRHLPFGRQNYTLMLVGYRCYSGRILYYEPRQRRIWLWFSGAYAWPYCGYGRLCAGVFRYPRPAKEREKVCSLLYRCYVVCQLVISLSAVANFN